MTHTEQVSQAAFFLLYLNSRGVEKWFVSHLHSLRGQKSCKTPPFLVIRALVAKPFCPFVKNRDAPENGRVAFFLGLLMLRAQLLGKLVQRFFSTGVNSGRKLVLPHFW